MTATMIVTKGLNEIPSNVANTKPVASLIIRSHQRMPRKRMHLVLQ